MKNAVVGARATIEDAFEEVIRQDQPAPFFVIKFVLERLRDSARIINVSSMSTRGPRTRPPPNKRLGHFGLSRLFCVGYFGCGGPKPPRVDFNNFDLKGAVFDGMIFLPCPPGSGVQSAVQPTPILFFNCHLLSGRALTGFGAPAAPQLIRVKTRCHAI